MGKGRKPPDGTRSPSLAGDARTVRQNSGVGNSEPPEKWRTVTQRLLHLEAEGFATVPGVKDQTWRAYLRGESKPGQEALEAIARGTGCDGTWLLTGVGVPWRSIDPATAIGARLLAASADRLQSLAVAVAELARVLFPLLTDEQRAEVIRTLHRLGSIATEPPDLPPSPEPEEPTDEATSPTA